MWTACFLLLFLGPAIGHGEDSSLQEGRQLSDDLENRTLYENEELRPKRQFITGFTTPNPVLRRRFSPVARRPSHRTTTFRSSTPESTTSAYRVRHEGPEPDLSSFEFRRTVPRNPTLYTPSYRTRNSEEAKGSSGESAQQLRKGSRRGNGLHEATTKRPVTNPVNLGDFRRQQSSLGSVSLPNLKKPLDNIYTLETVNSVPDSGIGTATTPTNGHIKDRRPVLRTSSTSALPLKTTMETAPALVTFLENAEDDNGLTTETAISRPTLDTFSSSIFNRRPGFRFLKKPQTLRTSTIAPSIDGVDDLPRTKDIESQGDVSEEATTESSTLSPVTNNLVKFRRPFLKPLTKFQTDSIANTSPDVIDSLTKEDNESAMDITTLSPTTSAIPTTKGITKYRRPFLKPLTQFQTHSAISTTETPINIEEPLNLSTTENLTSHVTKAGGDAIANSYEESSTTKFEPVRNGIVKLRRPILKPFRKVPMRTEVPTMPIETTTEMATFISTTEDNAVTSFSDSYVEQTSKEEPFFGDKTTTQIEDSLEIRSATPIQPSLDLKRYKELKRPSKNAAGQQVDRAVTESDIASTTVNSNDEIENLGSSTPKTPIMTSILKKLPKFKVPVFSLARKPSVTTSRDTIKSNINSDTMTKSTVQAITDEPEPTTRKYTQVRLPSFKFGKVNISSPKRGKFNQQPDITTVRYETLPQTNFTNIRDMKYENHTGHVVATGHKTNILGIVNQGAIDQYNEDNNTEKQRTSTESSRDEGYLTIGKESDSYESTLTSDSSIHNMSDTNGGSENRSRTLFSNKKLKETISSTLNRNKSSVLRPATPYPAFQNKLRSRTLNFLRKDPLGVQNDSPTKVNENVRKVENSRFFVSTTPDDNMNNASHETVHKKVEISEIMTKDSADLRMNIKPIKNAEPLTIDEVAENFTLHESDDIINSEPIKEVLEITELKSRPPTSNLKIVETTNKTNKTLYDPIIYENGSDHRLRLHLRPRKEGETKPTSKIVVTIQHVEPSKETEDSEHSLVPRLDISENGDLEYKTHKLIVTVQVSQFKENSADSVCKECNNKTTFHLSFQDNMTDNSAADSQEHATYLQTSLEDETHTSNYNETRTNVKSSRNTHQTEIRTEAIVHNPPSENASSSSNLELEYASIHRENVTSILTTNKCDKSITEHFKNDNYPGSKIITSEQNKSDTEQLYGPQADSTESVPTLYENSTDGITQSELDNMEHTTDDIIITEIPEVTNISVNPSERNIEIETSTNIQTTEMFSTQTDYDYTKRESTTEMIKDQYTTIRYISETMVNDRSEVSIDNDQSDDVFLDNALTDLSNQISSVISETDESFAEVDEIYKSTTEPTTKSLEISGTSLAPMIKGTDSTNEDQYPFTFQQTTESVQVTDIPIQGMIHVNFNTFTTLAETSPTGAPRERNRNGVSDSDMSPESLTNRHNSFYNTTEEEIVLSRMSENLLGELSTNGKIPNFRDKGDSEGTTENTMNEPENIELATIVVTKAPSIDIVKGENTSAPVFETPVYTEITTEIERTTLENEIIHEDELVTENFRFLHSEENYDMPIIYNDPSSENVSENFVPPTEKTGSITVRSNNFTEIGGQEKITEDSESTMKYDTATTETSNAFHRFVLGEGMEVMNKNESQIGELGSDESDEFNDVVGTDTTTETSESFTKADWSPNAEYSTLGIQRGNSTTIDIAVSNVDSAETLEPKASTLKPLETFE